MMGRYSLRLRNIWGEDEPTWGESAQRGIESGLDYWTKKTEADREFGNEVSRAGGTVARQPGIADRLRGWKDTLRGRGSYNTGGEFDEASIQPFEPTGHDGALVAQDVRPRTELPIGVTPWNPNTPKRGGRYTVPTADEAEASVFAGQQQPRPGIQARPQYGIAGAIDRTQRPDDSYEIRGPSGQRARIPRGAQGSTKEQEIQALARDIELAQNGDQSALARVRARQPSLLSDVEPFSQGRAAARTGLTLEDRLTLEEQEHRNALAEIDRRGGYSLEGRRISRRSGGAGGDDDDGGESELTKAQRISALRAQLQLADDLSPPDAQQRRRLLRDPSSAARVRQGDDLRNRINTELNKLQGITTPEVRRGVGQNQATAQARARFLTAEARRKYPDATPAQIKRAVAYAMKSEGYEGF